MVDWILEIRVVQRIVFVMFRSWHKEGRGGGGSGSRGIEGRVKRIVCVTNWKRGWVGWSFSYRLARHPSFDPLSAAFLHVPVLE